MSDNIEVVKVGVNELVVFDGLKVVAMLVKEVQLKVLEVIFC